VKLIAVLIVVLAFAAQMWALTTAWMEMDIREEAEDRPELSSLLYKLFVFSLCLSFSYSFLRVIRGGDRTRPFLLFVCIPLFLASISAVTVFQRAPQSIVLLPKEEGSEYGACRFVDGISACPYTNMSVFTQLPGP
jgi:hypothetical protein